MPKTHPHPLTSIYALSSPSTKAASTDDEAVEKARHCRPGAVAFALVNPHDRIFGPHRLVDGERILLNASTMRHSAKVVRKIAAIAPGQGPISYRRLTEGFARTLVAGHRAMPVHPWLDRTISVREAARIQSFPDDYVFCGPRANRGCPGGC